MKAQHIRITKEFTFDMAHALYGHDGLCKNIHGHTYHLHITLIGIPLNQAGHPKDGMLIDFTDLKHLVQVNILAVYDHALVLNAESPHAQLKALDENFEKIVYFKQQPTCENLLLDMVEKLQPVLPPGIALHHLKLQETPSSSASWYWRDNV